MIDLLACVERGADDATHSIILLHGLGADGHDFEPIVNELNLKTPTRFIFPHAPSISITINNGMDMPAWYDIKSTQIDQQQDEDGVRHSEKAVIALIERELKRGIKSENIILAGFSQGGAVALHTALRYSKPLAGVMGLSTYLPLAEKVASEMSDENKNIPVFLAHGIHDPIIPLQLALNSNVHLENLHYSSELKQYEMEHSVCQKEIDAMTDWINRVFS